MDRTPIRVAAVLCLLVAGTAAVGCATSASALPTYSPIWIPQARPFCAAYEHAAALRMQAAEGGGVLVFVARPDTLKDLEAALVELAPTIGELGVRIPAGAKHSTTFSRWSLKEPVAQRSAHGSGSGAPARPKASASSAGRKSHSAGDRRRTPLRPIRIRISTRGNEVHVHVTAESAEYADELRRVLEQHVDLLSMGECDWQRMNQTAARSRSLDV